MEWWNCCDLGTPPLTPGICRRNSTPLRRKIETSLLNTEFTLVNRIFWDSRFTLLRFPIFLYLIQGLSYCGSPQIRRLKSVWQSPIPQLNSKKENPYDLLHASHSFLLVYSSSLNLSPPTTNFPQNMLAIPCFSSWSLIILHEGRLLDFTPSLVPISWLIVSSNVSPWVMALYIHMPGDIFLMVGKYRPRKYE